MVFKKAQLLCFLPWTLLFHSIIEMNHDVAGAFYSEFMTCLLRSQAKLMSKCSKSIDNVKRVQHILNNDQLLKGQGLTILSSTDKQTGV